MIKKKQRLIILAFVIASSLLAGCVTAPSQPAKFYWLTSLETERGQSLNPSLIVGIGPVTLPGYIDRAQLVSQVNSNQLSVDEFNRWAGDLEQNVIDVLAENLSHRLGTDAVVAYPWGQAIVTNYQVVVDIRRFDVGDDQNVHLIAQWQLLTDDGRKLLKIKREALQKPVNATDPNAIAAAQSWALVSLGRSISSSIVNN